MHWKKRTYVAHRWVGLLVCVQLLAWSVGGLTFSLLDLHEVRGENDRSDVEATPIRWATIRYASQEAVARAAENGMLLGLRPESGAEPGAGSGPGLAGADGVGSVVLRERRTRTVYEIYDRQGQPQGAVDARTGEVILDIGPQEAGLVALADFVPEAQVRTVTYLQGTPPSEYRGKPMPVYQVILDHPKSPHIYVSPITGTVTARRNRSWRIFDFFWMLHIMDYRARESFNHPLLMVMSGLTVLTSASGILLWGLRASSRRRRTVAIRAGQASEKT